MEDCFHCRRNIDPYSAFYGNDGITSTGLAHYLRERALDKLYLAGLALDFCVFHSVRDGKREGFDIFVIEDACRAIDQDSLKVSRKFSELSIPMVESTSLLG